MKKRFVLVYKSSMSKTLLGKTNFRGVYFVSYDPTRATGLTVEWTNDIDQAHTFESERQAWDKAYHIYGISHAMQNHAVLSDWVWNDNSKEPDGN